MSEEPSAKDKDTGSAQLYEYSVGGVSHRSASPEDVSKTVARIKEKNQKAQAALVIQQTDIEKKIVSLENDLLLNQFALEKDLGGVDSDGAGVGLKTRVQKNLTPVL